MAYAAWPIMGLLSREPRPKHDVFQSDLLKCRYLPATSTSAMTQAPQFFALFIMAELLASFLEAKHIAILKCLTEVQQATKTMFAGPLKRDGYCERYLKEMKQIMSTGIVEPLSVRFGGDLHEQAEVSRQSNRAKLHEQPAEREEHFSTEQKDRKQLRSSSRGRDASGRRPRGLTSREDDKTEE